MKHLAAILLLFTLPNLYSQDLERINELISSKRTQVDKIEAISNSTNTLIPSSFSEEQLKNKALEIKDLTIVKVYYVYTQYKLNASFDQINLDKKRFSLLNKLYPGLIYDPFIEWELIEQTACKDFKVGPSYFHGFILVHRPLSNSEDRKEEIRKLMEFLDNPQDTFAEQKLDFIREQLVKVETPKPISLIPDELANYKDGDFALYQYFQNKIFPSEINKKRDDLWVELDFPVDEFGRVGIINIKGDSVPDYIEDEISEAIRLMPEWTAATKNGKKIKSSVNLKIRVSYSRAVNGMYTRDGHKPSFIGDENRIGMIDGTTQKDLDNQRFNSIKTTAVFKGMEIIDDDEKIALVMDVTGSMSRNIAALKKWIQLNPDSLPITSYSFFNDGDNKSTSEKKKGKTGGIYMTRDVKETNNTIETAILAGSGGEPSESDMEAVLYAIEHDSLCDAILLIADNYSEVRDISMLRDITKKVHVLLCESPEALRVEYLKIVKETGGYLIINGQRIELNHLQKGDEITIQERSYLFTGDEFKMRKTGNQIPGT